MRRVAGSRRGFTCSSQRIGMRMNPATQSLTDALSHPGARLTQRLRFWLGTLDLGLDVLDFKVRAGLCDDYTVDVTVTSPHRDIDGKLCVGRRAGLQIDEAGNGPPGKLHRPRQP